MHHELIIAAAASMPAGKRWLLIEHATGVLLVVSREALGRPKVILEVMAALGERGDQRAQRQLLAAV